MIRLIQVLAVLVVASVLSPAAFGQGAVHIDMSGSQFEVHGPETFRIRNLSAAGFPGLYWVDMQWNPTSYLFVVVGAGSETPPQPSHGFISCPIVIGGNICDILEIQREYLEDEGGSCLIRIQVRNKTQSLHTIALFYRFFDSGGNELPGGGIGGQINGSETKTLSGVAGDGPCSRIATFEARLDASFFSR